MTWRNEWWRQTKAWRSRWQLATHSRYWSSRLFWWAFPYFVASSWAWLSLQLHAHPFNLSHIISRRLTYWHVEGCCWMRRFDAELIGCVGSFSSCSIQFSIHFSSVQAHLTKLESWFIKSPWGLVSCINRGAWHSLQHGFLGIETLQKL